MFPVGVSSLYILSLSLSLSISLSLLTPHSSLLSLSISPLYNQSRTKHVSRGI